MRTAVVGGGGGMWWWRHVRGPGRRGGRRGGRRAHIREWSTGSDLVAIGDVQVRALVQVRAFQAMVLSPQTLAMSNRAARSRGFLHLLNFTQLASRAMH